MVKQFDTDDTSDFLQTFRHLDVLEGWLRVAARMLMADNERRRIIEDSGLEVRQEPDALLNYLSRFSGTPFQTVRTPLGVYGFPFI